jgi:hypothetical protein
MTWFNNDQAQELVSTMASYNPLAILVGHTHSAEVYSHNGTHQGIWNSGLPGFVDVINAPATQKEDGQRNALPSEFMVMEASFATAEDEKAGKGTFRVAQRVGHGWGTVLGSKTFQC